MIARRSTVDLQRLLLLPVLRSELRPKQLVMRKIR